MKEIKKIAVIGDGGWGTALALVLAEQKYDTTLWCAFPEQAEQMRELHENKLYLPGIPLPKELKISADIFSTAENVDLVVSVVPTKFLRTVIRRFEDALPGTVPIVSATKGLEIETFSRPTQIILDELGDRPVCALTGPTHAEEVARKKPASIVAASTDHELAEAVQKVFTCDYLRVYASHDPIGAELGGALKNVIAIAAGISDGLELGDNAKAALLTRGMVEMARFGKRLGARAETFFGLAGFGDLVTTCCSQHSRNRLVGERIGAGETLQEVLGDMKMVAEGVNTTKALFGPESETRDVSMPIAEQVHAILFENKSPYDGVVDLMTRAPAREMEGLLEATK